MMNYQRPCDRCEKSNCDYRKCAAYHKWLNTSWKIFRGYKRQTYKKEDDSIKKTKFVYLHPDVIRKYLQNGPCGNCPDEGGCDVPCGLYLEWWDARMEWFKWRFGAK